MNNKQPDNTMLYNSLQYNIVLLISRINTTKYNIKNLRSHASEIRNDIYTLEYDLFHLQEQLNKCQDLLKCLEDTENCS
jgi:hypothetical protein